MKFRRLGVVLVCLAAASPALVAQENANLANPGEVFGAVLPVVGSTPGNFGSYFKTAVQVHNPGTAPLVFRLVFHPAGRSGTSADPSETVSVPARGTVYFADMLPAMGIATGLGSLDVFVPTGGPTGAVAVVRVFNDAGAAGTSGFTEDFVSLDSVINPGQSAYMVCPPDFSVYRFNVGVRTLDQGATLRVTVRNVAGAVTKTVTKTYGATFFEQTSVDAFLGGAALAGSESLTIEVTAGNAVIYGATTDNRTNDASYQRAQRLVD